MRKPGESDRAWERRLKARARRQAKDPAVAWRLNIDPEGAFDEIVVGPWLHVEQLNHREFFVRLGTSCFWVHVDRNGVGQITHTESLGG